MFIKTWDSSIVILLLDMALSMEFENDTFINILVVAAVTQLSKYHDRFLGLDSCDMVQSIGTEKYWINMQK